MLKKASIEFETERGSMQLEIEQVRFSKQFVLLKFKGIDNMDQAENLRGGQIIVSDSEALPLEEDEYYIRDLYGMNVSTDTGEHLGEIEDVLRTGAHDVYVVRPVEGKDILIPAVKQYILSIDVPKREIVVHLVEGLRP